MAQQAKKIKLITVYSNKDTSLYNQFKPYLEELKSTKQIYSLHDLSVTDKGLKSDKRTKLETFDIILIIITPTFIASEYCYGSEIRKVAERHKESSLRLVPLLFKWSDFEDTRFNGLPILPSNNQPIEYLIGKDKKDAFADISNGIEKIIKERKQATKDSYMLKERISLPFCVKRFSIRNFLCIKDVELSGIESDAQWVFLTGENGDGKTALLQALAIGLLGNNDSEGNHLLQPDTNVRVEFKLDGENNFHEVYNNGGPWQSDTTDMNNKHPKNILGYGVTRLNIMTAEYEQNLKSLNPALSLFNETDGNHRNIENWLKDQKLDNPDETPQMREVKETLKNSIPNIDKITIEGSTIYYHEKGYKATYSEISAGGKSIIAMIGSMMIQLFNDQPDTHKLSGLKGIVLIDELDLHLHPIWQRKLPGLLTETFPLVQFWASTHSIIPFMGAPKHSVLLNVTREKNVPTQIRRLDIDVEKLLPNTLLSSPLFGLEDFIRKGVNDFRSEYLYSEYERNKQWEEKLEEAARTFKLPKSAFELEEME